MVAEMKGQTPTVQIGARVDVAALAMLLVWAGVIWLPALATPYWGDDYVYLLNARAANLVNESWWRTFWPSTPLQFWRPLSQEAWWRVVERLGADVSLAHAAVLALHVVASCCVGLLGGCTAVLREWERPAVLGALSGALYGVSAVALLPVHWVAAVNSPILVALTGLLLSAWLRTFQTRGACQWGYLVTVPLLLVMALLSKESAILTPVLMLLVAAFAGVWPGRRQWWVLGLCVMVGVVWLLLRHQVTLPPAPQYAYAFGGNLLRNAASSVAWLLNVPREALRMVATGELKTGGLWAVSVALCAAIAWWLALYGGLRRLSRSQWSVLLAFPVFAYAPYFPLVWNSYAYYAAVALMLPSIALARLLQGRQRLLLAAFLLGLSGWLSVAGTRWLEHPGLIGRARWAEETLQALSRAPVVTPLWLKVENEQRFYAIGASGLAWWLELPPDEIHPVPDCPQRPGTCLEIHGDGTWTRQVIAP